METEMIDEVSSQPSATKTVGEEVKVVVTWGGRGKYEIVANMDDTVAQLKEEIEKQSSVPKQMQKLFYKGAMPDTATLRELKLTNPAKVMLIGSTLADIANVNAPPEQSTSEEKVVAAASKETLCEQKPHQTIIGKGVPDDVMPGIKNVEDPLPSVPLSGMVNKKGEKVRLTFKLAEDQLWIGTKERTNKIPMSTIKEVISEPIVGHEEYHIMAIQIGPTEASRYWIYWVPAQYVRAIKRTVLGI